MPSRRSPAPDPLLPLSSRRVAGRPDRPGRRARAPRPRSAPGREPPERSVALRLPARPRSPVYRISALREAATRLPSALFPARGRRRRLAEARPRESGEDLVARRPLFVPRERDVPDEVRTRRLEPVVPPESRRQPADAALAADPSHPDRLLRERHGGIVGAARSPPFPLDPVDGTPRGFPRVIRGARPERGLVLDDARVPAYLLGPLR